MAIEISNCVPIADDAECTPWEGWHGSQPDVEHFCVPLCDVDFHVYSTERRTVLEREKQGKKLSDRRRQGVLIGYSHDQRSYKILRTNGKKSGTIVYRRYADCQFDQKCKLPKSEKARARSTEAESAKLSKELKKMLPNIESIDHADPAADDHDDGVASEEDAVEAPEEQGVTVVTKKAKEKAVDERIQGVVDHLVGAPVDGAQGVHIMAHPITAKEAKMTQNALAKDWQVPLIVLQQLNPKQDFSRPWLKFRKGFKVLRPRENLPMELQEEIQVLGERYGDDDDVLDYAIRRAATARNAEGASNLSAASTSDARSMSSWATEQMQTLEDAEFDGWNRRAMDHGDSHPDQLVGATRQWEATGCVPGMDRLDGYRSGDVEYLYNLQLGGIKKPRGHGDAHASDNPNADDWTCAEDAEIGALKSKYEEVPLDEPRKLGKQVGRGMWQYAVKIDKLKARWCYDGSRQQEVPDDIAAQVLRYSTARLLMIKGVHHGNSIRVSDVSNAFLHHPCEPFYMHHPPGRGTPGTCMKFTFCLYGRREAPMGWSEEVTNFLVAQGFSPCPSDSQHWVKRGARPDLDVDGGVFVDDFLMQGPTAELDRLEAAMSKKWPVKHMGEITNEGNGYLAMDVTIDRTSKVLEVNQHRSLEKFVHQQGLDECKPLSLPMQKALKLERAEKKCTDKKLLHEFRSAVGSLMHYAVVSRPDIAFAAVKLARLQLYCTDEHLQVAKGVVRYLAGTKNYTLRYDCAGDIYESVICAVDSDWAEGENCKSTSGFVYMVGGAALTWACTTQRSVAHSSCEAEYVALDDVAREIVSIHRQMQDFNVDLNRKDPVIVLEDNQSAQALAQGKKTHGRTKHIDVRYHYIRELIRDKVLQIVYQPSEWNPSDLFTKQLGRILFQRHVQTVLGHAPLNGTWRANRK